MRKKNKYFRNHKFGVRVSPEYAKTTCIVLNTIKEYHAVILSYTFVFSNKELDG